MAPSPANVFSVREGSFEELRKVESALVWVPAREESIRYATYS